MITFRKTPLFDDLFQTAFDNLSTKLSNTIINENKEVYTIEVMVPGLTKKDVSVLLDDGNVKISYQPEEESSIKFTPRFEKIYKLPKDINNKGITAKVENGILTVLLPKDIKKTLKTTISVN